MYARSALSESSLIFGTLPERASFADRICGSGLLGITCALYRAERDGARDPVRLQELMEIGEEYKTALDLARRGGPQSLGASAAWDRAARATERLCTLVGDETKAGPMVLAAAGRVKRRG
jgi:hypothetical protein